MGRKPKDKGTRQPTSDVARALRERGFTSPRKKAPPGVVAAGTRSEVVTARNAAEDSVPTITVRSLALQGDGEMAATIFDHEAMQADSYVAVWRRDPIKKTLTYLYRLEPLEAREDMLQAYSGGGQYVCKLAQRMGDGHVKYMVTRQVEVGGDPAAVTKLPAATTRLLGEALPPVPPPPPPTPRLEGKVGIEEIMSAGLLNLLQGTREVQAMQLETFRTLGARPTVEWDKVLVAAVPIIQALLTRESKQPDVLTQIKELATLIRTETNADPTKMVRDQLELMDSYLGLRERITPPEDASSGPLHVMERILGVIEGQQKKLGRPPSADEVRAALPAATGQSGAAPGAPPVPMWTHVLQRWGAQLVAAAMRNADPDVTADYVAQMLPDAVMGSVVELLQMEDNGARVLAAVPRLAEFPQWTTRFFTRLWANVGPEEEEEEKEGSDDAER